MLIHLIDGLSADPMADFSQVNSELALFDPNLANKPQIVALNKMYQPQVRDQFMDFQKKFKKLKIDLHPLSAIARTNTKDLLIEAVRKLEETPVLPTEESLPVYRPELDANQFEIRRLDGDKWRVSGIAIERSAKMTYWEHAGSVRRFQNLMRKLGVDEALRKAGIREGDTIFIDPYELEWKD